MPRSRAKERAIRPSISRHIGAAGKECSIRAMSALTSAAGSAAIGRPNRRNKAGTNQHVQERRRQQAAENHNGHWA